MDVDDIKGGRSEFTKNWAITLSSLIVVVSIACITVASIFHAELTSVGQLVFVAGAGLAFIKNHLAQEEQITQAKNAEERLAEKLRLTEEALAAKVSQEAKIVSGKVLAEAVNVASKVVTTARVLSEKTDERFAEVAEAQEGIKTAIQEQQVTPVSIAVEVVDELGKKSAANKDAPKKDQVPITLPHPPEPLH